MKFTNDNTANSVRADFTFVPDRKGGESRREMIVFLQAARAKIGNQPLFPRHKKNEDISAYYKAYTDPLSGLFLDHLTGQTSPYLNAKFEKKAWKDYHGNKVGGSRQDAEMSDTAGFTGPRTKLSGDAVYQFETAIISIEPDIKVLGVVFWGFTVPADPNQKLRLLPVKIQKAVTPEVASLIRVASRVQGKTIIGLDWSSVSLFNWNVDFPMLRSWKANAFLHTGFYIRK